VGGKDAATLALNREPFSPAGCVVSAHGDIDLYSAPVLQETLAAVIDEGATKVVVDLTDVGFMDSTGLGVLVGVHKRLDQLDGSLVIVSPDETVTRVFELVGLARRFEIRGARPPA